MKYRTHYDDVWIRAVFWWITGAERWGGRISSVPSRSRSRSAGISLSTKKIYIHRLWLLGRKAYAASTCIINCGLQNKKETFLMRKICTQNTCTGHGCGTNRLGRAKHLMMWWIRAVSHLMNFKQRTRNDQRAALMNWSPSECDSRHIQTEMVPKMKYALIEKTLRAFNYHFNQFEVLYKTTNFYL